LWAFNSHFLFDPTDERGIDDSFETISVSEAPYHNGEEVFSKKSRPVSYIGRELKYLSNTAFAERQKGAFSWALEIEDLLTLIWDCKTHNILYIRHKNYTEELLRFWLFHTFFPLVLELEGRYHILHAASVEIEGRAMIFSAPSYGGKSTLVDCLMRRGYAFLSDDIVVIDAYNGRHYAISSYPYHRPFRKVETLGYPIENRATAQSEIGFFFVLKKTGKNDDISFSRIKGSGKLKAIQESSYIDFAYTKKEYFAFYSALAREVKIYELRIPWDLQRLDEVCGAVLKFISFDRNET